MLSDEFFRPPIGPPKFVYLRLTMIFKEALKFPVGRVHPAADRGPGDTVQSIAKREIAPELITRVRQFTAHWENFGPPS